jgi:hypothetical protein
MTSAPYASRGPLLALTALVLVLAVLALQAFGVGPSLFLFALAGLGVVELVRRR